MDDVGLPLSLLHAWLERVRIGWGASRLSPSIPTCTQTWPCFYDKTVARSLLGLERRQVRGRIFFNQIPHLALCHRY